MSKEDITITACIIAYNHEQYIEQCILGALEQQQINGYEILISDDCSSDRTSEICEYYGNKYPTLIRYIRKESNIGMIGNWISALKECRGKYIAICEGDDYWTDPQKLKRQVDFLETNLEYNLVTTAVERLWQDTGRFELINNTNDYTFTYKDMIVRNHCHTCTTLFRNYINGEEDFKLFAHGSDSQIWIRALGKNGKGRFLSMNTAVYRKHDGGISTIVQKQRKFYEDEISACRAKIAKATFWNKYFDYGATFSVLQVKNKMYKRMYRYAQKENRSSDKIKFMLKWSLNYVFLTLYNKKYKKSINQP